MLNTNKISEIVGILAGKLSKGKKDASGCVEYEKIDWGELYKEAVEHAEEVEVHACGDFPVKLIGFNFPNESNEEKIYRQKSFQPITKPYWAKAISSTNRIWSEQNFKIDWKEDKTKEYFMKKYPLYGSVIDFFREIVTRQKIDDPNAVLVIDFKLPVKQMAEGEIIIDTSKEIETFGTIYESEDVLCYETNDFALFVSEEKSDVQYFKIGRAHV